MKVKRKHITHWIRLSWSLELFPWYRNDNYRGFFHWLWFCWNWYPSIGEQDVHPRYYNRYMNLAKRLCG